MSIVGHFTAGIANNNSWRIPYRSNRRVQAFKRIRVHNDDASIAAQIAMILLGLAANEAKEQSRDMELFRETNRRWSPSEPVSSSNGRAKRSTATTV